MSAAAADLAGDGRALKAVVAASVLLGADNVGEAAEVAGRISRKPILGGLINEYSHAA